MKEHVSSVVRPDGPGCFVILMVILGTAGGGRCVTESRGCENGGWARCEVDPVRLV